MSEDRLISNQRRAKSTKGFSWVLALASVALGLSFLSQQIITSRVLDQLLIWPR